jgi:hypothetical protein
MAWPGTEEKFGVGMWVMMALLAAGALYTFYSLFISPSDRTIFARDFRKDCLQRSTSMPDDIAEQYLAKCERELRKRLGLN